MFLKSLIKQRQKYIAAMLVVGFVVVSTFSALSPVVSAWDPAGPGAPGTSTAPFYKLSAVDQAKLWSELSGALSGKCMFAVGTSAADIVAGSWFSKASNVKVGHHVEPNDGVVGCNNENGWFKNILDAAGFSGDYVTPAKQVFTVSGNNYTNGSLAKLKAVLSTALFGTSNSMPTTSSPYISYQILMSNFTAASACNAKPYTTANDAVGKDVVDIYLYTAGGGVNVAKYVYDASPTKAISVGFGLNVANASDGAIECRTIASQLHNSNIYANAMADYATATGDTTGDFTNSDSSNSSGDTCKVPDNSTGRWLTCMLLEWGENATNLLDKVIQGFLFTPTEQIFTPQLKTAWNTFRIVGVVLILITGLVMVISQAIGLEIFDAYTVKKILPRLLIAAIGISLSWPIMQFVITFFNDLGVWSHDIILYPFRSLDNNAAGSIIAGGIGITAGIPIFIRLMGFALFPLLGTIILGLLVGLLVLSLRQIIILMAVLMAPLAIAAYILPGTQKLWEFWKNTFLTALYMFPIIMGFIAGGKALALVAASVTGSGLSSDQMHLLSVLVYFAPYFLLPFAFKLAGGLMATVFSIANDKNRGAFDRLRKARQGMGAQHRERTITRPTLQARANVQRRLMAKSSKTRVGGAALRGLARGVGGYNLEARMSALNASVGKEVTDQIATGADGSIRGSTVDLAAIKAMGKEQAVSRGLMRTQADGTRQYKSLGGAWVGEADVMDGHRRWGGDVAAQQAALSYEMRKAMTDEQVGGISERYSSLAKNQWKMTESEAGGAWIGAGFENQNHHLEYKNTDWGSDGILSGKAGTLNAEKFSKEAYEQKGSYQMSQMSAHTITQLKNAYDTAGQTGDTATQQRIQAVAETFMSRYGSGSGSGGMNQVGDDMVPTPGGPPGAERSASFQTNAQGSGHVAEAVRDLAVHVGVYQEPDPTTRTTSPGPAPPMPRQN